MRGFGRIAAVALVVGAAGLGADRAASVVVPAFVHIPAGPFAYRPAGEFRIGTRVIDAPTGLMLGPEMDIMTYQVNEAEYALCMADDGCPVVLTRGWADYAQTGVNHADAGAYAVKLLDQTDQIWRLPTDAEWVRAAGDQAEVQGLDTGASGADPSRRWLAAYKAEVALRGEADFVAHPRGHFGLNDRGLADIAGNVWEWTDSRYQNGSLSADGLTIDATSKHCGARAVQGKHRAFVIEFIRDARSGGCGAGVPPDFLGFRLVRDPE